MRWRWLLWLLWHLWLRAVEPAFVGLAVAANGTAYYADDDAPRYPKAPPPQLCVKASNAKSSVLRVGVGVAVPLYAAITGLALSPDGAALFVSLGTNAILRLSGLAHDASSLSALPPHESAVVAGRAGVWGLPRYSLNSFLHSDVHPNSPTNAQL